MAQPMAYFHTLTRLWEFTLGGLLALHVDRMVLSRRSRIAAGWIGALGLVTCGMALQVAGVFPGFAAALARRVRGAGTPGGRTGSPAGQIGCWPVLILYLVAADQETIGLSGGALVIAVSVVLAALTHHLVERPVLRLPTRVRTGYRFKGARAVTVLLPGHHLVDDRHAAGRDSR